MVVMVVMSVGCKCRNRSNGGVDSVVLLPLDCVFVAAVTILMVIDVVVVVVMVVVVVVMGGSGYVKFCKYRL